MSKIGGGSARVKCILEKALNSLAVKLLHPSFEVLAKRNQVFIACLHSIEFVLDFKEEALISESLERF